jgi:hypothetical protein
MSIECTTSANSTVTCLYSADPAEYVSRVPHSPQNLAGGLDCAPQEPQNNPVAVSPPPPSPLGSTSVSCHRCSVMSVISPRHLAHEVLRPRMSSLSRRVRPVRTVKKRLLPPGTTQVSSSKAGRLLQRPVGDLTGVDAVGRSPRPSPSRLFTADSDRVRFPAAPLRICWSEAHEQRT